MVLSINLLQINYCKLSQEKLKNTSGTSQRSTIPRLAFLSPPCLFFTLLLKKTSRGSRLCFHVSRLLFRSHRVLLLHYPRGVAVTVKYNSHRCCPVVQTCTMSLTMALSVLILASCSPPIFFPTQVMKVNLARLLIASPVVIRTKANKRTSSEEEDEMFSDRMLGGQAIKKKPK